jgi:hypothetical protein
MDLHDIFTDDLLLNFLEIKVWRVVKSASAFLHAALTCGKRKTTSGPSDATMPTSTPTFVLAVRLLPLDAS